eukprot:COSAG05_NODE_8347_length_712_cov_1.073409_1_plen_151_part_00
MTPEWYLDESEAKVHRRHAGCQWPCARAYISAQPKDSACVFGLCVEKAGLTQPRAQVLKGLSFEIIVIVPAQRILQVRGSLDGVRAAAGGRSLRVMMRPSGCGLAVVAMSIVLLFHADIPAGGGGHWGGLAPAGRRHDSANCTAFTRGRR